MLNIILNSIEKSTRKGKNSWGNIQPGGCDTGTPLNLKMRIELIRKYISTDHIKILDCGCGNGEYVISLIRNGYDTYGIEYDKEKVFNFRKKFPEFSNRILVGNIESMPINDSSFTVIILNEVIEHVGDEIRVLNEVQRVLSSSGKLIVFCPNRFYPFEAHGVFLKKSMVKIPHFIPFIPYIPLNLGKIFFRYWARNYFPWEIRALIRGCGFKIIGLDYVWQTFENITREQPHFIKVLRPFFLKMVIILERISYIKIFGVSQVIIAKKL
jgi:SAM-dependent methyltransferase